MQDSKINDDFSIIYSDNDYKELSMEYKKLQI